MLEESALLWISWWGTTQPKDTYGGGLLHALSDCGLSACKKQSEMYFIFVLQEATVLPDCSNRVIVNKTKIIDMC